MKQQDNLNKFLAITNGKAVYKSIPNHPDYIITTNGNVFSLKTGKFIKHFYQFDYPRVTVDGKTIRVHVLMAETFIGPRPKGYGINHKDGNKWNNNIENIEYATQKENVQHALRTGLIKTLDNSKCATKKNDDVVNAIFDHYMGQPKSRVAKRYNITIQYLNQVLWGKLRRNIWSNPFIAPFKPETV